MVREVMIDGIDSNTRDMQDNRRWAQVVARDHSADGTFVFAVRTTGIFCRPGCPARRPRRENVTFFDNAAAAMAAGFRSCRRCDAAGSSPSEQRAAVVERACRRIETAESEPTLTELAAEAEMSPSHFQRVFAAITGLSPKRYAIATRRCRFRRSLESQSSVTDAVFDAGFGSLSAGNRHGNASLGMAASNYRRGGAGEAIRWTSAETSLGSIVVALTDRGACLIEFVDASAAAGAVRRRFPQAAVSAAEPQDHALVAAVVDLIDNPCSRTATRAADLPLDIRGTAFQQKVWSVLRAVAPGRTVSYAELAEAVGRPGAARAVAGACAANGLAVVIPCHRVIRGTGDPAGYRWGVERKLSLLDREKRAARRS
ncbi:bifunctional DNA-binding transcriptional regulator/O6-methylguanine-DNA methyltransferase Ada [Fodinicurvata sp. EGI_FJ10296]|uniref:bifunctional DNA-binding transcriptional regulator/O6-methylguanine-DNA methyltransferase Ada n=1 Tax=Fodinicurvata sp. EGI_FJ10296 TaxID=3231908 RepID=UPI0034528AAD